MKPGAAVRLAHRAVLTFLSMCLLSHAAMPCAQNYPSKTVRLVTTDAGGSSDFFLRPLAQALGRSLGHAVGNIVVSQP